MSLLQMSFSGAVMIAVIAVLRALALQRLPKAAFLALWLAALARLLIPISLPAACSVYLLFPGISAGADTARTVASAIPAASASAESAGGAAGAAAVSTAAAGLPVSPWRVLWLIGALTLSLYFALVYWRRCGEFRQSLPVENDAARAWLAAHPLRRPLALRQSDRVSTPLTYGVLRPTLLVPGRTDWTDQETLHCVLAHEYVHIRRFDALTKLLLTAAVCVHWFNPLVWVMYVLANRDIELSCDEAVLRRLGASARAAYATALIRMEETKSGLLPFGSGFAQNETEERIVAIMKWKKSTRAALLVSAALLLGIVAFFATQPTAAAENDGEPTAAAAETETVTSDTTTEDAGAAVSVENTEETTETAAGAETETPLSAEDIAAREATVRGYYTAFENGDYEGMKAYCTEEWAALYAQDGGQDVPTWAKLIEMKGGAYTYVPIAVELEEKYAETSPFYAGDENGIQPETMFIHLMKDAESGIWLISSIGTGP